MYIAAFRVGLFIPVSLPAQEGGVDAVDHHGALSEALVPAAGQRDADSQTDLKPEAVLLRPEIVF